MRKINIVFLLLLPVFLTSCMSVRNTEQSSGIIMPLIIYKTSSDYSKNLPVVLDKNSNKIISYPGINDVYYNGKLALPLEINDGYLIDNMGISKNSVYTSYTLGEYSEMDKTPSPDYLLESIIEREPFIEMYDCGPRDDSKLVKQANAFVENGFKGCRKILISTGTRNP